MKNILIIALLLTGFSQQLNAPYWGKTGHRATAEIAADYLTPTAKKNIENLLDGKSMALVSTFGDDIKSNPKYDKYRVWHYIDIPQGKTYEEVKNSLGPNLISAIKICESGLKDTSTPRSKKKFYLKMLVHLIGDLHQPLHVGHSEDKGGNTIRVFWFGKSSNLHRVWDEDMINSYLMSYTELAKNQEKLSKAELEAIQKGSPVDWMKDTREITKKVYQSAHNGDHLGYDYMYRWMPVVREQLQKGGIRLAVVLNGIFG